MKPAGLLTCLMLLCLLAGILQAAPYGQQGLTTEWTQPNGNRIALRVMGDEFFGRTETLDGYTVIFDPATKTYYYATLSVDGNEFISTGQEVGKVDPASLGLPKGININPASRAAKARKNFEAHEAVVKQQERWEALKAANRNYRAFKNEVKKQEQAGKKGFVIPLGTVLPDSEIPPAPQMAPGDGTTQNPPIEQAPPSFTLTGDIVGLTILVDFSDAPGTVVTQAQIDDYCNKPNYTGFSNAGSIYDYFFIQSGGKLRYNNNVTYYVRVPQPKTYYNNTATDSGACGRLLLNDALNVLIANGYDFSTLTTKTGGNVRCCNVFFAGANSGVWSKGLWPHRWVLSPSKSVGGGKYIYDYQITEIGTTASMKIGTFCHENGHMLLGYPDLYNYDGNAAGVGNFSLMDGGNYGGNPQGTHPVNIDPYLKEASGWMDVIDLTSASNQRCTVQTDGNQVYRYNNPAKTTEYFLFEVRDNTGYEGPYGGQTGSVNPSAGLVAYHVYETGSNTNSSIFTSSNPNCSYTKPYELMIVEANQKTTITPWYDDTTPDTADAFKASGKSSISDTTTPELKFWDPLATGGGRTIASGCNINTISADGPVMTFMAGTGSLSATPTIALSSATLNAYCNYGTNAASQTFNICNSQGGTLNYTVSDNQTWLSCTPTTGSVTTGTSVITVNYATSGLAAGTYSATITVTDPAASPTSKTITVTLTVTSQPVMTLTAASIAANAITGMVGPQKSFGVRNTGGGSMTYTVSATQPWLTISPTTGTVVGETDTIYLNFNATSLAPGTYTDTVTVTSTQASNSPRTIPITFTVQSTDMILTSPVGGETWYVGNTQNITWASSLGGTVKIELLKAGVLNTTIATGAPNTGTYSWSIPGGQTLGTDYKIRVTSVESPTKTDVSLTNFTLDVDQLAVALDTTGLIWTTNGDVPWFKQTTAASTHDGVDCAESGNITHSQTSSMETTIVGPGTMTFWWKVSSETNYDFLTFYLNGVEQTGSLAKISGTPAWAQKTVTIPAGSNVVKWTYGKDGSVDGGTDTAWVDQVVYTPTAQPEIAVEQPLATDLTDGSATVNFGSVNTGSNTSLTFTIKNVGTADLTGIAPTISGTNSADYTVTTNPAATVAPGGSTTCVVRFTPGASGTRTALLQIASDDANENPFDINLTGTGVGPGSLAVSPAGNFAPSGTFGGPFTATQIYTLSNPGNTSINWTAGNTQTWCTLSATSGTLAAGTNTTVTVSINTAANSLNAGNYSDTVTFTNTTNASGNTTRGVSLTVNPMPATVTLGNLAQTYNGSPKSVTVTTNPASLANSVTYNGSATAPTNAGTYAVVATITNPNYSGSASGSLVIAKAAQTISFNPLATVLDNAAPFALTATASSGLGVTYTSSNTAVATVAGSTVTVVGLGTTTITAAQAGNANYEAAPSVGQTLTVERSNPLAVPGGPYKVIVGQSLSLDGSASQPSYGYTVTNYQWDLNNDGTFTDATGANPAAITSATLISTWGMVTTGPNTIKLRITDSAGKTSTVSTTVDLINALTWDANAATAGQTNGAGGWLNANQWWDGTTNLTWTPGANASFGGPSTAGGAVSLASPTSVGSITFNTFTGTYLLGTAGQALTISGGINKITTSAAVTFASPLTLGGNQTWTNSSAGVLTVNDAVNNGGFTLTTDGTGTVNFATVASVVSGAGGITVNGGLTKLGSGTAPAHTYSGDTTINGGVVMFANNFSPNSNINLNGGILESYWNSATINALGSGPGQIRITGGVSGFSLNGNTGQTVNLGNAAATINWGDVNFAPTKLVLQSAYSQSASNITFANPLNLNGATRTILVNSGTTGAARAILSGAISNSTGTAGLVKEGAGMLNLTSATSAWNGTTTISEGLLDMGGINLANIGGGSGRNISVAGGAGVRFNTLSNAILNRITETTAEITIQTGGTANNLDFGSSTGANLPNAFLGCWASNGAKTEYTGTLTPAADAYRLGGKFSNGLLGIVGTNKLTGARGLIVGTATGGGRVELAGANDFTGNTVLQSGRLTLGNNLALQNSPLDVGASGGTFSLSDGTNAARITGDVAAPSPTFGGLIGSRNLASAFSGAAGGNNETVLAATAVTGFTLNPGSGVTCTYSGAIADFAVGTTLTKTGAGSQILGGANTYTGATTVSAGKLFIDGSLSTVATTLDVANGATLGGKGTIGRNVTIADGGQLEFDISTAAASHDRLDIAAGCNFTFSGTSVLTITSAGGGSPGSYTLLTGGNNLVGVAPATLNLPVGWAATVSISGNSLILNVTSTTGGAGSLAVTGATGLSSSGTAGGPFSPNSIVYTLSNPGQASINWTASNAQSWVSLTSTGGTLAAGANTTVTVSINTNANALAAGSYSDTVNFTNTTNATGNTTRSVSLTVNPLGTYTISYNGNGNTGGTAPSNQIKTQGTPITLSGSGTLVRSGYTFSGWNTAANGSGTAYAAGASYSTDANLALFAQWTANTYTVTFNANGGDAPSSNNKTVTYGSTYGALATTARTGYTFNGWFTAPSGGTLITAASTVATASNHTLYAQWTADTSTVTFNSNGGDVPSPTSMIVSYDSAYGALATVTRTGYTFTGWYTAPSGGTLVTAGTLVTTTADHTLYAQWTINTYTVSYNANNADSGTAPSDQTKTHDVNLTLATNSGNLARTGYTFSGWNTAADGSGTNYATGASYTTNADLTLYAKWAAISSTVTFDANGGTTPVPTSMSVTYGSTYGALATTSRTGYSFNGWFTAAIGGTLVTSGTSVTAVSNHTLYAHWTQLLPELDLARTANPIATGGYDSISSSTAGVDTKLIYDITNNGNDTLTMSNAVVTGNSNCSVTIDSQPASSLAPAANTTLIFTAVPSVAGAWRFSVSLASNDPNENPYIWTVHGVASSTTTVTLTATADTYIANGATTTNYGTLTTFSLHNRSQASNLRYGLMKFDLSGIPTNATVTTASIDLVQSNTTAGAVDIYEATGAWTETGATWSNSSTLFGATSFGSATAPGTANGAVPNIGLNGTGIAKIQSWVTTPAGNNGFGIKTANGGNGANVDLHSREASAAYRPKLNVTYTANPQVARMHVARGGTLITDGSSDTLSGLMANSGTQVTYTIANLGNTDLTLTTPITVSGQSNCTVTVTTQPNGTVAAPTNGITAVTNMVITVTPAAAGPWSANLSITNNDTNANPYNWSIGGTAVTLYTLWASGPFANTFSNTATNANPDGDSFNNLQEFAFGLDPTHPAMRPMSFVEGGALSLTGAPITTMISTTRHAIFTRRKDYSAAGLNYTIQFSADMSLWTTSATTPTLRTSASDPGNYEAVSVPYPASVPLQAGGSTTPKFFRVGVN